MRSREMQPTPDAPPVTNVDLLIIGGGINGAGIARDAAGRGLSVALVEQSDLASSTSSASTKLIHGGLRYLEHFEFRLVREALIERERMLAIAPHLVRPMEFVLPHVAGLRPRWQIRLGLFFYDHMGTRRRLPASRGVRIAGTVYGANLTAGITHGFAYADCWVDDSRLVVLNAMDAAERGAAIHTRTKFLNALQQDGRWLATCQQRDSGRRIDFQARAIVNAAGPWVEQVLRNFPEDHSDAQVRLVKGSHIVIRKLYEGEHAYLLQNPDGRVVFAIPYEGQYTLVGTTDVPFSADPTDVAIAREETEYLCDTVNRYFRTSVSPIDVVWSYAGVRPLSDDEASNASRVTRDYKLEFSETAAPLLSVFGGKITTYRRLAEQALEKLQPHLGGSLHRWTRKSKLPGGDFPRGNFAAFLASVRRRWPFLAESDALRLARAYGTRIERVLGTAQRLEDLGEHFGAGLTSAEIEYLRTREWAVTAADILWRRTKRGLHMSPEQRSAFERAIANDRDRRASA
jgi:glycerol-3-phosphate dehydrogenase